MNSMETKTSREAALKACSPLAQGWLGIVVNLCPLACKDRSRSQPFFPTVQLYVWFITVYIRHTRRSEVESLAWGLAMRNPLMAPAEGKGKEAPVGLINESPDSSHPPWHV